MRKLSIALIILACAGLVLFIAGRSGIISAIVYPDLDLMDGYDAVVPYGTSAHFTITPPSGWTYGFYWSGQGTGAPTMGSSSTFTTNPTLAPSAYSCGCAIYKAVYVFVKIPGEGGGQEIEYWEWQWIPYSSYEFTWLVTSGEPSPTPSPSASPTPMPSPSPSPSPTPTPTPTPTPSPPPLTYYTVTVTASPSYAGQITISPSASLFAASSTVTLTATAYSGWQFDHWQETAPYSGALYSNPLSFSIDTNYVFTAVYTQLPTSTPTPSGSPEPNASPTPTPTPSPTLPPPASAPPTPTPTPTQYQPSNEVSAVAQLNVALQYIGLTMAILSGLGLVTIKIPSKKSLKR